MIFDIHIHEKTNSPDSHICLDEIVQEARRKGLNGICITDHDSNGLAAQAHIYGQNFGFPIIVGSEILTYEGDILVFGLNELPANKMHAWELLALVARQGGVGIAAHPYRDNNRGLKNQIRTISNLSGFEVLSGRTEPHNNMKALSVAQKLGRAGLGGSDAHELHEVGKFGTYFPQVIKTEADFIEAIKTGRYEPVFYSNGRYQRLRGGLGDEDEKVVGVSFSPGDDIQPGRMQ